LEGDEVKRPRKNKKRKRNAPKSGVAKLKARLARLTRKVTNSRPKKKAKRAKAARKPAHHNPRTRSVKGKTGRWYKGPRGTRVRVLRKHGGFEVQVK
jgi:hypothetical protein